MVEALGRAPVALSIYRRLVGARIRADWQYRTSFVLLLCSQFAVTFLDFLAIAVLFTQVPSLAGWSFAEVAFLYATTAVSFMVCDVFVSEVGYVERHLRLGTFDQFLLRPLGPLLQLCAHEFALRRVGKLLQALVVLVLAVVAVPIEWTATRAAMTVVTLVAGTVIFSAISVTASCISFWFVGTEEIANSFTYGGNLASQYPLDVYGAWLRRVLVIVPIAFVNYLPATWILGKPDALGLPAWAVFASPLVAVASSAVAALVWREAIRHHRSTGS